MVGGLYLFKLEHSYQVITLHILRQPWPSKLHDEEIWLKITAVYSELHEMYFESNEIFKRKSLDHSNCFYDSAYYVCLNHLHLRNLFENIND